MTSSYLDFTIDADDLDKAVSDLMTVFEADTAAIASYEGLPCVTLSYRDEREHWFLLADEKPEHAPGEWFQVASMMATRVDDPRSLCLCEPAHRALDGVVYPGARDGSCPVCADDDAEDQ